MAAAQTADVRHLIAQSIAFIYAPAVGAHTETIRSISPQWVRANGACSRSGREQSIYNIVEDDGAVSNEKAKRKLGFDAVFRIKS